MRAHNTGALHLSVAAGIRSDSIAQWLGTERIIRTMPNTPALIGKGMAALFARPAVTQADKDWAGEVIATTGAFLWLAPKTSSTGSPRFPAPARPTCSISWKP